MYLSDNMKCYNIKFMRHHETTNFLRHKVLLKQFDYDTPITQQNIEDDILLSLR